MKDISDYLNQLKYDPKLATSFISKYLTNIRLVILVILSIVLTGLFSFFTVPKRLNPEVKIPIVFISTVLPGASPEDIESLITIPIEDEVAGIKGVTTLSSSSSENVSTISLEFESSVDPDQAKQEVQSAVDSVTDLPEDATTPRVGKLDFEDQPVWQFALTSSTDTASLMKQAEILKNRIEDLSRVDRVVISGWQEQEIQIIVKPEVLKEYSLNPLVLNGAVKAALGSYPAGSVKTDQSSYAVTIDPTVENIQQLRDLSVTINNQTMKLGEIATIQQVSKPDQTYTYYSDKNTNEQYAVNFDIYKSTSSNIDTAVADTHQVVDETLKDHNDQFTVITLTDFAKDIDDQFTDLLKNFRSTILLVFFTLLMFLGIRQALIASFSIPLTFLVAFTVMNASGLSLNFITMFSLLLGLGMLVDDAIVVISAMTNYYRTGKFTATETGLLVWKDFIVPIWTTTLTTVWAFVPLLLSSGILGEFIKSIPIVVSSTLLTSTAVAVLITLPLMIVVLKPSVPHRVKIAIRIGLTLALVATIYFIMPKNPLTPISLLIFILLMLFTYNQRTQLYQAAKDRINRSDSKIIKAKKAKASAVKRMVKESFQRGLAIIDHGIIDFSIVKNNYNKALTKIINSKSARRKTIFVVVFFSILSYLLVPAGLVVNEFFPKSDFPTLYAGIELPQGTNANITDREIRPYIEKIKQIPEVKYVLTDIGRSAPNAMGNTSNGNNLARLTIILPDEKDRKRSSVQIAQEIRDLSKDIKSRGEFTVTELSGGPPAGAELQIKILGEDLKLLDEYANSIKNYMETTPGIIDPMKSVKQGTSKISFVPDQQKLADAGLTPDQIGIWLRTFASGLTFDDITIDDQSLDINFRLNNQDQLPEDLGSIEVMTPQGAVPLLSLGKLELKSNPTVINREDQQRTISVAASVQEGYVGSQLNKDLEAFANNELNLKDGYTWQTGGINEENQKSVQSILQAMLLSTILILITMVIQLGAFRKALIVLLVIPLAVSGVFVIFALTGTPLSFPALIGVLALFGIVVNNSIVIVERINQNLKANIPLKTAIIDAATGRIEPIVLSSASTIMGLIPITLSDPLWRGLGGAIISGLAFSGIIMLFFIPSVYYTWYQYDENNLDAK